MEKELINGYDEGGHMDMEWYADQVDFWWDRYKEDVEFRQDVNNLIKEKNEAQSKLKTIHEEGK